MEEEELARALPYGEGDVGKILAYLEEKRLIETRYAEGGIFCVRTVPAGRAYPERAERESREEKRSLRDHFLWSFWGSLAGGALITLLALLLEALLV